MKIVQIVTQMEAAGAQKVAYLLHRGLASKGHSSELWFLYTKRPAYAGQLGVFSILDNPPSAYDYITIAGRLYQRLRRYEPDAVITHTHYANVMGQALAAIAGVSKRMAVHHNQLSTYPKAVRLADCILGHVGLYSDVVVVSDAIGESVTRYLGSYSKLVHRIHNSVESAYRAAVPDARPAWGIPPGKPILLSVGRLSRQKNHSVLFQALCSIPDAYLVIVGDGELSSESRRQVKALSLSGRVVFTGEVNQEQVHGLMTCASLFVLPSLWEGLSMAALEALSTGMATVASDIAPNREVFGDAALFVPATDVNALAGAINRVLGDTALAKELRSKAKVRSRAFSLENQMNEYERLLCASTPLSMAPRTINKWD